MKQIIKGLLLIAAVIILSILSASGQNSAFVGALSNSPTKLTVKLMPSKSETPITVKFDMSDSKEHDRIQADIYDIELPELNENQKIVVRLMYDQYIAKEWIYTRNTGVADFSVRLIGNSTLHFQLIN